MKHLRHIALLALIIVYPLASTAHDACSPEKVYLHFDRSCHTAGDTAVELRSPRGHLNKGRRE